MKVYFGLLICSILLSHVVLAQTCEPACLNGGQCSMNGTCICPATHVNTEAAPNCLSKSCGGVERGKLIHNYRCQCKTGWEGNNCMMCKNDMACVAYAASKASSDPLAFFQSFHAYCDQSFVPKAEKSIQCDITGFPATIAGDLATMHCPDISHDSDSEVGTNCTMHSWKISRGAESQLFYCNLADCKYSTFQRSGAQISRYMCSKTTECKCLGQCSSALRSAFTNISGRATLECNEKTSKCQLTHTKLPITLTMGCKAAECVVPPSDSINSTSRIANSGISFLLAIILSLAVFAL